MLTKIKEFFLGKSPAQEPVAQAPYKIETPEVNWPFPRPMQGVVQPVADVAPVSVKKTRAPAKPKATPAAKSTKPQKTPAK